MPRYPLSRASIPDLVPALPKNSGRRTLLFLSGLAILLSANANVRFEAAGLLFQPVLVPVALLWFSGSGLLMKRIPNLVRTSLVVFVAIYSVVEIVHGFNVGRIARTFTLGFIVFGVAGSIEDDDDVRAVGLGLVIAMGVVSTQAMVGTTAGLSGINPFAGVGNQNAFSLYALPAALIGAYFALASGTPHRTRIIMAAGAATCALAILSTTNRSGYLGLALIVVLLVSRGRNPIQVVGAVVLSVGLFWGFTNYGDTSAFDRRVENDGEITGRETREALIEGSIRIGLRNPILGVGQDELAPLLAREINSPRAQIASHNLFSDLFAGGGFPLLASFVVVLVALSSRPVEWKQVAPPSPAEEHARSLLRVILVLFLVRGLFGGEALTTPGFMIAVGLGLGATIAHAPSRKENDVADDSDPVGPATASRLSTVSTPRPADTRVPSRLQHPRRLIAFDPWSRP